MHPRFFLLFLALFLAAAPARALRIIGDLAPAQTGLCLKSSGTAPSAAQPKFTGSEAVGQRVRAVYQRFSDLGLRSGLANKLNGLRIEEVGPLTCGGVTDAGGCARAGKNLIQLSNRTLSGAALSINYGIIAHELAHMIDTRGSMSRQFGGISCATKVSSYCGASHGESFAEAVAAFAVDPEHLKRTCREAYDFVRTEVFDGREPGCGTTGDRRTMLASSGQTTRPDAADAADCDAERTPPAKNLRSMTDIRDRIVTDNHVRDEKPVQEARSSSEGGFSFSGILSGILPMGLQFMQWQNQQNLMNQQTPQMWYMGPLPTGLPSSKTPVIPSTAVPSGIQR